MNEWIKKRTAHFRRRRILKTSWCSTRTAGAMHGVAFAFFRSRPASSSSDQTASHAAEKRFNASDKMSLGECRSRQELDQHLWRPACTDRRTFLWSLHIIFLKFCYLTSPFKGRKRLFTQCQACLWFIWLNLNNSCWFLCSSIPYLLLWYDLNSYQGGSCIQQLDFKLHSVTSSC